MEEVHIFWERVDPVHPTHKGRAHQNGDRDVVCDG